MASSVNQVLTERQRFVRKIVLNRPKQLNVLSYSMASQLLELFLSYEKDQNAKLVILKGNGRAFCCGGDVDGLIGDWKLGAEYFKKEFTLCYVIGTYSKPQVSFLNGFVMGQGGGVSFIGKFRVVTEKTIFEMPETTLGFPLDVAVSYSLSRLPGFFGEYIGVTGARLDGAEMLACGLATHFVHSSKLPLLENSLCENNLNDINSISAVLDKYADRPVVKEDSACHWRDIIDRCFSLGTIEEIKAAIEKEASLRNCRWISTASRSMNKLSPISLKLTLRMIRESRLQDIGQCLVRYFRTACHCVRGDISRDFQEGCRAMRIDKDRDPKWDPPNFDRVTDDMVDRYFSKIDDEDWEELKLPPRSNLPAATFAVAKL